LAVIMVLLCSSLEPRISDANCLRLDQADRTDFQKLLVELTECATDNLQYYEAQSGDTELKFASQFSKLIDLIDGNIRPLSESLFGMARRYDFAGMRANGYRSLLFVTERCCRRLLNVATHVRNGRQSLLFRSGHYQRELKAYISCLDQLHYCLHYAERLPAFSAPGSLFVDESVYTTDPEAKDLMLQAECIAQECFYGRCLGFQFCDSVHATLLAISIGMATFAEDYKNRDRRGLAKWASTLANSSRHLYDHEGRAAAVVNMTRNATVDFCLSFWNSAENPFFQSLPMIMCPSPAVSEVFHIPPTAFQLPRVLPHSPGAFYSQIPDKVNIAPPVAHRGPDAVACRLLCHRARVGMTWLLGNLPPDTVAPSNCLIFHVHGGGFVAQSSRSQEVYLRHWARDLDCPIVSVDYSLAPKNPFPRALEEVFFSYAWCLNNFRALGSTGQRIIAVGDSAGGNLILSMSIRCVQFGIRPPDLLLPIYTPALIRFTPSPSRLMAIMDPLLPVGILTRCLLAYAGIDEGSLLGQLAENGLAASSSSANAAAAAASKSSAPPDSAHSDEIFSWDDWTAGEPAGDEASSLSSSGVGGRLPVSRSAPALPQQLQSPRPERRRQAQQQQQRGASELDFLAQLGERHFAQSPIETPLTKIRIAGPFIIPLDPFMSPYLADDADLARLPPVHMIACRLDPCLDDSIMLARKLSELGRPVKLDVLSDLPHGFLNFNLTSRDAKAGSDFVVQRLREAMSD
ncbi:hypothetical protein BOX15_Mlig010708g1, partial [Macrostomum lignano]